MAPALAAFFRSPVSYLLIALTLPMIPGILVILFARPNDRKDEIAELERLFQLDGSVDASAQPSVDAGYSKPAPPGGK